jgi:hypothetical protein
MSKLLTEIVQWRGVRVQVQFYFTPGCPETGPSYASGGEPETYPEIDTQRAWIVDDDDKHIGFLCAELRPIFDEDVYHDLVASAAYQLTPDADAARDAANDEVWSDAHVGNEP